MSGANANTAARAHGGGPAPPSAAPSSILVQAARLKKYFPIRGGVTGRTVGFVRAVDGVDLQIERGKTLGLIGESGCGKTTVGRCLLRLLEPTDGLVVFNGITLFDGLHGKPGEVKALPRSQMRRLRRDMQVVFQDPFGSLNPRLLVSRIVSEGLRAFHRDLADRYPAEVSKGNGVLSESAMEGIVAQLMADVGLNPEHLNRFPHEFSGGQRQRICVARALALKPSFVVLDEPTSALDVSVQAQILNLLKEIQRKRGLTYLFISHHLAVIRHMCDNVAVMYLGKIVEQAPNEALFDQPLHPYTVALLSAIPSVDPQTRRERIILEGDVPSPANPPSGCRFHTRCMFAVEREVVEAPLVPVEGLPEEFVLPDPRAVPHTVRLVVEGTEIDSFGAGGTLAYEVGDEGGDGLHVTVHVVAAPGGFVARYRRFRELCANVEPPLAPADPGHLVACHFHDEVRQALVTSKETGRSISSVMKSMREPVSLSSSPATPSPPKRSD